MVVDVSQGAFALKRQQPIRPLHARHRLTPRHDAVKQMICHAGSAAFRMSSRGVGDAGRGPREQHASAEAPARDSRISCIAAAFPDLTQQMSSIKSVIPAKAGTHVASGPRLRRDKTFPVAPGVPDRVGPRSLIFRAVSFPHPACARVLLRRAMSPAPGKTIEAATCITFEQWGRPDGRGEEFAHDRPERPVCWPNQGLGSPPRLRTTIIQALCYRIAAAAAPGRRFPGRLSG